MKRIHYWAPPILYMALIFRISGGKSPGKAMFSIAPDVGWHAIAYAVLGFLLYRLFIFRIYRNHSAWSFAAAWIGGAFYGASDEFHQSFVPTRHMTLGDWIADFIGAGLGALLAWGFYGWLRRKRAARDHAIRPAQPLDADGGSL